MKTIFKDYKNILVAGAIALPIGILTVSYTHLTLPTTERV